MSDDLSLFMLEQADRDQELARALVADSVAKRLVVKKYLDYAKQARVATDPREKERLEASVDALHWVLITFVQSYTDRTGFRPEWDWKDDI